jgi:hypothetical protein
VSEIKVSTSELAHVAGTMLPSSDRLRSSGSTVSDTVGIPVGLAELDGALEDLASSLGQWLNTAGERLNTLAYNTQAAADVYELVEANNKEAATPVQTGPSNVA